MFGFNDDNTVRLLADDRYRTYRSATHWSRRRSTRRSADDGGRRRS